MTSVAIVTAVYASAVTNVLTRALWAMDVRW
jgi:hypothetical protein